MKKSKYNNNYYTFATWEQRKPKDFDDMLAYAIAIGDEKERNKNKLEKPRPKKKRGGKNERD